MVPKFLFFLARAESGYFKGQTPYMAFYLKSKPVVVS